MKEEGEREDEEGKGRKEKEGRKERRGGNEGRKERAEEQRTKRIIGSDQRSEQRTENRRTEAIAWMYVCDKFVCSEVNLVYSRGNSTKKKTRNCRAKCRAVDNQILFFPAKFDCV